MSDHANEDLADYALRLRDLAEAASALTRASQKPWVNPPEVRARLIAALAALAALDQEAT